MAVGKNKGLNKTKKGGKKKNIDSYAKKEWYEVRAPVALFSKRLAARTLVNRTQGTFIASEALKGRVFEANLADLNGNEEYNFRKIKLAVEDVQGNACLTNFHGMDMTRDKHFYLLRKWQTLIEAAVDVRTTDGYTLRVFVIAFTAKQQGQSKKTCYAQASHVRKIRKLMNDIVAKEVGEVDLKTAVNKFVHESIGSKIKSTCQGVFPLQNVYIRKVKTLKKPKFDVIKLMELHKASEETGAATTTEAPAVEVETLLGSGGRL